MKDHLWVLPCLEIGYRRSLLLCRRRGNFLGIAFADSLNGRFIVAVDLSCSFSLIRKFVNVHGCLVVDAKLVGEKDAESSYCC
jgi:hypothetical protein